VAVAVGAFLAMVGMARGVGHAWTDNLRQRNVHVLGMQAGAVEMLATSIDQALPRSIERVTGVKAASGELLDLVPLQSGQTALLTGWPADSFCFDSLEITAGDRLPAGRQDVCMIGNGLAGALGLSPGQSLTLRGRTFTISGIVAQRGALAGQTVILPLPAMQDIAGRPGRITAVNICLDQPDDPQALADALGRLRDQFDELTFTETAAVAESDRVMQLLRGLAWGFSTLAVVIGIFVLLNTLLMSVTERTHEIGILSAIGWSRRRVVGMVMLEGALLTLLGSIGDAVG